MKLEFNKSFENPKSWTRNQKKKFKIKLEFKTGMNWIPNRIQLNVTEQWLDNNGKWNLNFFPRNSQDQVVSNFKKHFQNHSRKTKNVDDYYYLTWSSSDFIRKAVKIESRENGDREKTDSLSLPLACGEFCGNGLYEKTKNGKLENLEMGFLRVSCLLRLVVLADFGMLSAFDVKLPR